MNNNKTHHLPNDLIKLIDSEIWPKEEHSQELKPLVSFDILSKIISDEHKIIFYPPPFYYVSEMMEPDNAYWQAKEVKISEIQPEKALVLGDFGLGSDTVFALDYSNQKNPTVIKLCWNNGWVKISEDFAEFAKRLKLI